MATKEDLDALVELGREISDEEKRDRHLAILKEIAERIDVTLDIQTNEEPTKAQDSEEREEEDRRIQEEEKRIEEERRAQAEKKAQEEKRANEERAKLQAEQRRKEKELKEKEAKEREAKEAEAKEQENKNSFRRSSLRRSLNLSGTGNSLEEVQARIPKPTARGVDITDPSVAKIYVDVRDDNNPTDWMILRYDGQTNKIKVTESGSGGFRELQTKLVEEPLYGYFRYTFGDTQRTKFVFVSYVPDKLNGLKKAKIASHKPEVAAFLKYFHVEINALSRDDISVNNVESKLRSAGGADYGSGRGGGTSGGENFGGIKANAANFYAKTDKESKVEIVYHKGPLSTTPVDLSGRPMVASATEARKNTIDLSV